MIDRVWRAVERELQDIENIFDARDVSPSGTGAERRVRTLAALSRTLNQIIKLRQQGGRPSGDKSKQPDDDPVPRDLDEFRRELSRRLDAAIQIGVLDVMRTSPPSSPAEGERHVVATGATGAWTGHDHTIATYEDATWRFLTPKTGWCAWSAADSVLFVYDGTVWRDQRALPVSLDSVTHIGINTTASSPNLLSVQSNAALLSAINTADGGTGDARIQISKGASGNTASVVFSDAYSGRAEFGLVGSDAFKLKVSPDGSAFVEAFNIDQTSGNLALLRGLTLTGVIAPAQITSNQNDYNPASLSSASIVQVSSDAARSVSGLAGGGEGRVVSLLNTGSQTITLLDESASSIAANRFTLGGDLAIAAKQAVILRYDGTATRWFALARPGTSGASGALLAVNNFSDVADKATGRTNLGVAIGSNVQAWDADLDAVAALSVNGLIARTGAGTAASRSITVPAAGLTITSGDGVSGNPTLALANDLAAIEGLASTGLAVRTTTDTWAQRTLQMPAAGLTIANPAGIAGDPTFALANDLSAIENLSGTGLARRTGTDAWSVGTSVTNSELAAMANNTFKGNVSGVAATPSDLTSTQATAVLNAMVGDSGSGGTKGLVPAPSSGDGAAAKFLKADGSWAVPAGSGGGGSLSDTDRQNILLERVYQSKAYGGYRRFINAFADGFKAGDGINSASSTNYSVNATSGYVAPTSSTGSNLTSSMTSNSAPAGQTASAQDPGSAGYEPYRAFDGATTGTFGYVNNSSTGATTGWLQIQYSSGKTVASYNLVASYLSFVRTPSAWTLAGSNDGTTFTTLDTQSSQSFTSANQSRSYTIASPGSYSYYRLTWTAVQAGNDGYSSIQELQLIGVGAPNNMTLVTAAQAADASVSYGRVLLEYDNTSAPTLNTDLTVEVTGSFKSATATISIASPGVVTQAAHGLAANATVTFATTGALPGGLTPGVGYYVVGSSITTNTYQVSATSGGTAINTTGSQSGTHTVDTSTWTAASLSAVTSYSQAGRKVAESVDQSTTSGTNFAARIKTPTGRNIPIYALSYAVH